MISFILLLATILDKPSSQHLLTSKDIFRDTLELEDHSKWVVAPPDIYKTVGWESQDHLVLTPHQSLFSIYKFQYSVSNLTRNSSVRANFASSPCDYNTLSRWVISINVFANRLFLSDGSSWKIAPEDASLFKDWSINDFIIYGKNDQLLTAFPFILINARLNHHVRAVEF